jgi:hypothetical protein
MFTQNQIEQAKNLESKTFHNILRQVLHKSVYELKLEEAEKNWPYKEFTLSEFKEYLDTAGDLLDEEMTLEEDDKILTPEMNQKYPETVGKTYIEMEKFTKNFISNSKPPILEYVKNELIPSLKKEVKKQKMSA